MATGTHYSQESEPHGEPTTGDEAYRHGLFVIARTGIVGLLRSSSTASRSTSRQFGYLNAILLKLG